MGLEKAQMGPKSSKKYWETPVNKNKDFIKAAEIS
jgi:hypothetical protein